VSASSFGIPHVVAEEDRSFRSALERHFGLLDQSGHGDQNKHFSKSEFLIGTNFGSGRSVIIKLLVA
jgi:hypothetical protein